MIELDLLGADGDRVVMTDADGERYSIVVDDALRTAVRRARPAALTPVPQPPAPGQTVRPRDLQALMRAGASAQEVASSTGLDVEHVQRFEGPVLAERGWAVAQAKACHIGWEKDSPILGELVLDRLATRGVEPESLSWDALRIGREPWQVVLTFVQGAEAKQARWELDLTARSVAALDDEARWLTEANAPRYEVFDQDSRSAGSRHGSRPAASALTPAVPDDLDDLVMPDSQPLSPLQAAVHAPLEPPVLGSRGAEDASRDATEALLADLARNRGQRAETPAMAADELAEFMDEDDAAALLSSSESAGAQASDETGAQVVQLPGRRQFSGNHPVFAHPAKTVAKQGGETEVAASGAPVASDAASAAVPSAISAAEPEPESEAADSAASTQPAQDALPQMPDAPTPKPKRRNRRSVPSWDEIVFGAKPE